MSIDLRALQLPAGQLGEYLRRVGLSDPPPKTAEGLSRLHLAHALHVPFENLDIQMNRPISLAVADVFRKIVSENRGGFCYEQNILFASALRTLGFEMELLSARVRNKEGGYGPPFDHMVLRVRLGGADLLADVGFGECFREPVSADGAWCDQKNGVSYRLAEDGNELVLIHRPAGGEEVIDYRVDPTPRAPDEYLAMCRYHQTSPESHFTRGWVCSLATERGRLTLSPGLFTETGEGERREAALQSLEHLEALLQTRFGMKRLALPSGFPWAGS